jgi:phosphatidylglycerophosphatase A
MANPTIRRLRGITTLAEPTLKMLRDPACLLAFGLGSGLAPRVPGTIGTLAAIPLYLVAAHWLSLWAYLALILVAFVLGVYVCDRAAHKLGVHDHGGIVWDEFVGFWITMAAAPPGWIWVLLGFVLFRIFDMVKPWPIKAADRRVSGGFGIMLDDVLAGVAACICLQSLIYFMG